MINFVNLDYFVKIAEAGSVTRVAEHEHVSQQSLSNHIKKIEETYRVELFDRSGRMALTPAGEVFYRHAVRILSEYADMNERLSDMRGERQGSLKIGLSYTRGCVFLPEILPRYHAENPCIRVEIIENNAKVLEEYLLGGHIDCCLGADLFRRPDIEIVPLCREMHYLVVPDALCPPTEADEGAVRSLPLDISRIADLPFLLLSPGNRVRAAFDRYLAARGLRVNVLLEGENIETLFDLTCRGMGVTVYPEMFLRHRLSALPAGVTFYPIDDGEEHILSVGYRRKDYMSYALESFISAAKACFSETNRLVFS